MARGAFEVVPVGELATTLGSQAPRRAPRPGPRRWVRWTGKLKTAFLDHLAGSCDVAGSAAAIGVNPVSVYALRRKDPEFAQAWSEALALGYELLETQLIGHALAGGGASFAGAHGPMDTELAIRLLGIYRAPRSAGRKRGGPPLKRMTPAEIEAVLLKRLEAVERSMKEET